MKNKMNKFLKLYQKSSTDKSSLDCYMSRDEYIRKQENKYSEHLKMLDLEKQIASLLLIIRNPYLLGLYEAFSEWDMNLINNVLYQSARHNAIKHGGLSSGYDHCINFFRAIEALAANDLELVHALYPKELGLSKNGYVSLIAGTNLLTALWHNNSVMLEDARKKAIKFLASKRTVMDKAIVEYLLALADKNTVSASQFLLDICVGARKSKEIEPLEKCFCIHAHGLYNFAYHVLPEEVFLQIEPPEDEGFIKDLSDWNKANNFKKGKLFLGFSDELRLVDCVLRADIPKQYLIKQDDKKLYTDTKRFERELIETVTKVWEVG